jgi:hypothetical protein
MKRLLWAAREFFSRAEQNAKEQDQGFWKHWPVLVLSMAATSCIAVALGQDCSWDVLNYHFYSGFAFLHKPLNFDFAPAQVQSFFNPLMHVFSYLALAHLPSRLVTLLLGAIQGLNFYLVFQISQIVFRNWSNPFRFWLSLFNAVAGCYGAIFVLELGTTFGDTLISILILSGLLLIFRYLRLDIPIGAARDFPLGVAGAILGLAFGLKLTVAIYVAAIVVALLAILLLSRCRMRPLLIFFACLFAGFIAGYGFWGYNLYHEYRNPVFPYMNSLFQSPYYDLKNLADERFFARTWQQRYFYPFFFAGKNGLVSEIPFRDIRLALCYVAVISLAVARLFYLFRSSGKTGHMTVCSPRCQNLVFLAVFFVVGYVVWQYQFSVYRYLIVLELLAPTFLALVLAHFVKRRSWVFVSSLLLSIIIGASTAPADFGRQKFDEQFLKVEVPIMGNLEDSVVLMGGQEAISYVIPHFPASTRFVRISSNFIKPGQNANIDRKMREILARYDADHTFVYFSGESEKERTLREVWFYGVTVDSRSCRALLSRAAEGGSICRVGGGSAPDVEVPEKLSLDEPEFENLAAVRLDVNPKVAVDRDTVRLRVFGLQWKAMDVLFTINGERQPPQRKWYLDKDGLVGLPINAGIPRGLYHFIGIRNFAAPDTDRWLKVDARVLVR